MEQRIEALSCHEFEMWISCLIEALKGRGVRVVCTHIESVRGSWRCQLGVFGVQVTLKPQGSEQIQQSGEETEQEEDQTEFPGGESSVPVLSRA